MAYVAKCYPQILANGFICLFPGAGHEDRAYIADGFSDQSDGAVISLDRENEKRFACHPDDRGFEPEGKDARVYAGKKQQS
jgi:hypothetical protein